MLVRIAQRAVRADGGGDVGAHVEEGSEDEEGRGRDYIVERGRRPWRGPWSGWHVQLPWQRSCAGLDRHSVLDRVHVRRA